MHSWPELEKQARDGALDGLLEGGVGADDHRVLPAELGREVDEPPGALLGDDLPGGGAPREHHVVDPVDHRGADLLARAGDGDEQVLRQPGLLQQLDRQQRDERGLGVRLDDDGVAREQRRDGVRDGQRQRVVPGADDPDDTLRVGVLHHAGQPGQRAAPGLRLEEAGGVVGVVPARHGDVEELLEGPRAGLAGLGLDEVEEQVLPVEQQVVVAEEDLRALGDRALHPGGLRRAGPLDRGADVLGGAAGRLPHGLQGERRHRDAALPGLDRLHLTHETGQEFVADAGGCVPATPARRGVPGGVRRGNRRRHCVSSSCCCCRVAGSIRRASFPSCCPLLDGQ